MRSKMYLLAGHGDNYESLVRSALSDAGLKNPALACIATANGENPTFLSHMNDLFGSAGVKDAQLVRLLGQAQGSETARRLLIESDAIFVSGGEVEDGILGIPKDVRVLLRQLYELGKPIISVSAGTIMLGLAWPHWDDEDAHPEDAVLFDCLGFAPTIFDTHCEWEDWVELRKAVALSPEGFVGYGIPSGGMVVVDPDGSLHPTIPLDAFRSENGQAVSIGKFFG